MPPARNSALPERKVLVPIADGTEEMEAVIIIDVLRRSGANVTVASVEAGNLTVTASRKVKLQADVLIDDCENEKFDLIALPGGMPGSSRLRDSKTLYQITESHATSNGLYAAICAAPAVALHSWGLLHGKKATAYPSFLAKMNESVTQDSRVVDDGSVVTSQGPGTAFEFALKLVEKLFGEESARSIAGPMVLLDEDSMNVFRKEFEPFRASGSDKIPTVLVPIANGSEEMEAVIIADVLRRAGAAVVIASVESGLTVVASRQVKIEADALIGEVSGQEFDLIVLPGGMPGSERLRDCEELDKVLRTHVLQNKLTAAICAAPAVVFLAKEYVPEFKGTAHPEFSSQFPDQSNVGARVVIDRNIVTSRGPGTAMEFSLALVECLFGVGKANEVGAAMVLSPSISLGVAH